MHKIPIPYPHLCLSTTILMMGFTKFFDTPNIKKSCEDKVKYYEVQTVENLTNNFHSYILLLY